MYIKIKLKFQVKEIINFPENALPAFWFIRNNFLHSFSECQHQSSDLKGLITKAAWVTTQKLGVTKTSQLNYCIREGIILEKMKAMQFISKHFLNRLKFIFSAELDICYVFP